MDEAEENSTQPAAPRPDLTSEQLEDPTTIVMVGGRQFMLWQVAHLWDLEMSMPAWAFKCGKQETKDKALRQEYEKKQEQIRAANAATATLVTRETERRPTMNPPPRPPRPNGDFGFPPVPRNLCAPGRSESVRVYVSTQASSGHRRAVSIPPARPSPPPAPTASMPRRTRFLPVNLPSIQERSPMRGEEIGHRGGHGQKQPRNMAGVPVRRPSYSRHSRRGATMAYSLSFSRGRPLLYLPPLDLGENSLFEWPEDEQNPEKLQELLVQVRTALLTGENRSSLMESMTRPVIDEGVEVETARLSCPEMEALDYAEPGRASRSITDAQRESLKGLLEEWGLEVALANKASTLPDAPNEPRTGLPSSSSDPFTASTDEASKGRGKEETNARSLQCVSVGFEDNSIVQDTPTRPPKVDRQLPAAEKPQLTEGRISEAKPVTEQSVSPSRTRPAEIIMKGRLEVKSFEEPSELRRAQAFVEGRSDSKVDRIAPSSPGSALFEEANASMQKIMVSNNRARASSRPMSEEETTDIEAGFVLGSTPRIREEGMTLPPAPATTPRMPAFQPKPQVPVFDRQSRTREVQARQEVEAVEAHCKAREARARQIVQQATRFDVTPRYIYSNPQSAEPTVSIESFAEGYHPPQGENRRLYATYEDRTSDHEFHIPRGPSPANTPRKAPSSTYENRTSDHEFHIPRGPPKTPRKASSFTLTPITAIRYAQYQQQRRDRAASRHVRPSTRGRQLDPTPPPHFPPSRPYHGQYGVPAIIHDRKSPKTGQGLHIAKSADALQSPRPVTPLGLRPGETSGFDITPEKKPRKIFSLFNMKKKDKDLN